MKISSQLYCLFGTGLLFCGGVVRCAAEVDCDQTFSEVANGVEVVRVRGNVRYESNTAEGMNAARAAAINDGLNQVIVGRLKAGALVSNFILVKQFVEVQRDGFIPQYHVIKEKFESVNGIPMASVCVEASIRSIAFELTKEFLKNLPSLALAVIDGDISKSAGTDFMDGVYARLREKYGSGILLPPRQDGDAGIYKSPREALTANATKADFLIAFSGLSFFEKPGRMKTMGLSVKDISFYTLGMGPAEELPLSAPGESKSYIGKENVLGRKELMEGMQDWSVFQIDMLIRRAMADGDKIIAFPGPLSYEQFSDFSKALEKAAAGVNIEAWGKPAIISKQDKNYFRIQWRGTAFELAQALSAQLTGEDRKFKVEKVNFQTVLVGPVPASVAGAGVNK